jgi:hypothetical protein
MKKFLYMTIALLSIIGCDPYKEQLYKAYDELPVSLWLSSDPDFSMWVDMLKRADLYNAMNLGTGIYTCFVAGNDAVSAYLEENGYSSIDDIDHEELLYLMKYHIINGINISSPNLLLKLSSPTLSGDYLTAGVDIETEEHYIDNGEGVPVSRVIAKDIKTSNGIVHVLDNLLRPITESVWDLISKNGDYSIFAAAVRDAGLDTHLANTYRELLGVQVREYKTVFTVPDAVYRAQGIETYEDLKSRFSTADASDESSELYRYLNYHIMDNLSGYAQLTSFPAGYTSMILHNRSGVRGYSILDSQGVITFNPQAGDDCFHISDQRRDIPANNGYIHDIDNLGVIPDRMEHYVYVWDPADKIEFSVIPFYRSEKTVSDSAEEYEIISNGLEVPGIRYESVPATKAQIWYHSERPAAVEYSYNDAIYWNMGTIGWIEFDIPVLPVGKYRLEGVKSNNSSNGGKSYIYLDGETASLNPDSEINFVNGVYTPTWTTRTMLREETHTLRFTVGSTAGVCGLDRLTFVPVD